MADVKISALPAAASVALADVVPIVKLGAPNVTDQATVTQLRAALMPVSLTSDVSGTLPAGSQAAQTMGGDCSGTTATCTVGKIKGTTVTSSGGGLTTGAVLRVTGAAVCDYGPVDLANVSAVTGTLPTGNQAPQTMGGDVSGTTTSCTTNRIKGTTVGTAGGALTTDKVMRVTGAATADWGALNLAAAAAVTGNLPVTNIAPSGTNGWVLTTTGGVVVWQAPSAGATGGADTQILFNDAGTEAGNAAFTFIKATGQVVMTGFLSLGTGPYAGAGLLRFPYNAGALAVTRDSGGGNANLIRGGVDQQYFGSVAVTNLCGNPVQICNQADTPLLTLTNSFTRSANPIIGDGAPFGIHGAVVLGMTDADYTPSATEVQYATLLIASTTTLTAIRKVILPTPADEAHAYFVDVQNLSTGGFAVNVFRADGAGGQVQVTNGNRAMIHMRPRGAQLRAALIGGV